MPLEEFILTETVLLPENEGGRSTPVLPVAYKGKYRPHIVVEDRSNRSARIEIINGVRTSTELYLGIAFWSGPDPIPIGQPFPLTMLLMYAPHEMYRIVVEGSNFTIREGHKVIGHGIVKKKWMKELNLRGD
jgi:hypothetical protein